MLYKGKNKKKKLNFASNVAPVALNLEVQTRNLFGFIFVKLSLSREKLI